MQQLNQKIAKLIFLVHCKIQKQIGNEEQSSEAEETKFLFQVQVTNNPRWLQELCFTFHH